MKKLLFLLLLTLLVIGCKKTSFPIYQARADIYFSNLSQDIYIDSLQYSFGIDPDFNEDSIAVDISITGDTANIDRPFTLIVDKTVSDAVEGQDYKLPESNKLVIPRDSTGKRIYVKIFRSDALLDKPATLVLKLMPNTHFDTLLSDQKESYYSNVMLKARTFKIVITAIVEKPSYWDDFSNFLGDYSQQKLLLLLKVNDLKRTDDISNLSASYFKDIATKTQAYLNAQATAGNIIREKNGQPMAMGPDVQ